MKKSGLYLLILIIPVLGMIGTNELTRWSTNEIGYSHSGIVAINSAEKLQGKCTWHCHNNTNYCKEQHVNLVKPYFKIIDPLYFGIIHSLQSTGNYGLANIVFLVILIPLFTYLILVKVINMQLKINNNKDAVKHGSTSQ